MSNKNKTANPDHVPFGKLVAWQMRPISLGAVTIITMYLSLYCTDTLGMPAALVGTLLMASKIFDGVTDIFAGWLIDNTKTKWGKARPYELSIIGVWICMYALFAASDTWSMVGKSIWIFIMYTLIFSVFSTLLNAAETPYIIRAFKTPLAVTKVSAYGGIIVTLGSMVISVSFPIVVAIPIGTALAQSFNEEVCRMCGDIVGDEMEKFGIHLWLAPAMNIQRSPLCGRNFEYYSEDPLVSGLLAAAVTEGVQAHKGCGVTVKHFALNNQETNRMVSNSIASERAIREIYLKGFEICVKKSQPHALMSSYNLVNGEHACNSKDIQTYVLRNEWGYQGVVMTDWYVASTMMTSESQRQNKHPVGSPAGCIHAGNDIVMPGMQADLDDIMDALSNKEHVYPITKAELQVTAKRVLETVLKLA